VVLCDKAFKLVSRRRALWIVADRSGKLFRSYNLSPVVSESLALDFPRLQFAARRRFEVSFLLTFVTDAFLSSFPSFPAWNVFFF